jgi:UDP-glucose 4-epimerase
MSGRVLVTGGAGFIGSHIAEAYLAAGWEVVVLDDLSRGHQRNVPSGARFVRADIRSPEARKLLAEDGFTVLNHLAAQIDVRVSVDEPALDASINVVGLANLLEGAGAGGVKRVVFASSGGVVYGDPEVVPTPETAPKAPISLGQWGREVRPHWRPCAAEGGYALRQRVRAAQTRSPRRSGLDCLPGC